jgi:hypothetical protein
VVSIPRSAANLSTLANLPAVVLANATRLRRSGVCSIQVGADHQCQNTDAAGSAAGRIQFGYRA